MMFQKIAVLILLFTVSAVHAQTIFIEKFDNPSKDLKSAGWLISSTENEIRLTADGLEIDTTRNKQRKFITYIIPYEKGKVYTAEAMVKAENINIQNNTQRGASVFAGFLDENKKWVSGGTFPHGIMGSSGWRKVTVPLIMAVKPEVRFIQIWVVVEGAGKAWFKDLAVRELHLDQNYEINACVNPPVFKFNIPDSFIGNTENTATLELRRKGSNDYFSFFIDNKKFVLPHGLVPGEWDAVYSVSSSGGIFFHAEKSFTLTAETAVFTAIPVFPNGTYAENPELEVNFYPPLPTKPEVIAEIDGRRAAVSKCDVRKVRFRPAEKLKWGTHQVKLNVNQKKFNFLYNNRQVKHKIEFRDDKVMLLDNKPFFPVGTYRDPSNELLEFDGVKEAGFNLVHDYVFEEGGPDAAKAAKYLAACHKNGVMSFMGISRKAMRNKKLESLQRFCAALSGNNAAFVWYLIDEPVWQKINPYYVREYYRTIKNITPQIPVIQLHTPIVKGDRMLEFYGREGDIFWHDTYPVPKQPLDRVYEAAVTAGEIAPKQVLWSVIQAFDPDQKKVREKKPEDVEPKAGQIRCMTHLALAGGARGIIFYWLPQGTYDFRRQSPVQWAEVCDTTRELNELMPFLTGRDVPMSLNLPPQVRYWAKTDGSQTVLVLVNSGASPVSVKPGLPGLPENVELKAYEVRIFHPTR